MNDLELASGGFHWFLSLAPWALVAAFYFEVAYAAWYFGRWPTLWTPDPSELDSGLAAIDITVFYIVIFNVLCALAWPVVFVRRVRHIRVGQLGRHAATFISAWLVIIVQIALDPGGFVNWWTD